MTIVATLALTFGIGLTTTMFSIVYGALLTNPPYPDAARVVALQRHKVDRGPEPFPLTMYDLVDYRAGQRSFTAIGASTSGTMYLTGAEGAERFEGSWVTANLFDIFGVKPAIGRTFREGEDAPSAQKALVLSDKIWRDRYNANPAVVGTTIKLNGQPHTIIGVMPPNFAFFQDAQVWAPLVVDPLATSRRESPMVFGFGRLKPGVTVQQASADLATISQRLALEYKDNQGWTGFAAKFVDAFLAPPPKMMLRVMLGAVFFVLLIACANVANLLLDRAIHRTREVGVRLALGASRGMIARQFLAESFVLSLAATIGAIAIAYVGIRVFNRAIAVTRVPFWMDFRLHPAVFAFTGGIALLSTLIAGALPAWQSSRADINEILKDDSRAASGFRIGRISNVLVTFEIALSCILLVAAGLTVKSVVKTKTLDPGYETKSAFTARIGFPAFYTDTLNEWRFFDQLLDRVSSLPGVDAAAIGTGLPATRAGFGRTSFAVEGKSYAKQEDKPRARLAAVTPHFFAALRTPLVSGRNFTSADRDGSPPVVIVTRSFVSRFLPSGDPIGRRVELDGWVTIVGVVGDMFDGDQGDPTPPIIFRPFAQARTAFVSIVARTNGNPIAITANVREIVQSLDRDIPLYWVQSFDEATAAALWFVSVFGTLFMIFGAVALFLAAVGLYAVMSFSVSRRSRELGIRMALGATAQNVVRLTFTRGAVRLAVGMAIGMVLAVGVSQVLRFILFQVEPRDATVFGGTTAVLLAVGLVACLIPARRATRVDPMVALRRE